MKELIIILASLSIYAGVGGVSGGPKPTKDDFAKLGPNTSWDKILNAKKLSDDIKIEGTTVFVSRPVSAFDTCLDGDILRTTREFPKYERIKVGKTHYGADEDGYKYVKVGTEKLSFPITYTTWDRVCANNGKRCREVTKEVTTETIKKVKVKKVKVYKSNSDRPREVIQDSFNKEFIIPYCQ
ncbi:hypothetical protein BALOs_2334 [Halobacteriovorax sp. BALOs_7]|uniref:hypothetical protein n=1 Tax=unclassified Halobacteriovorax TaxID=2639665 RepID=UPI000EB62CC6|nr:hypothetical protein [Halobacteriovorax sp. BALOs_7]AYF45331.1 hypothetical protein BALOs_2334 [Halobacteriovorax sp. BALOs_7]